MKKKIILSMAAVCGLLVGSVLVAAARKPDVFQVERTVRIEAPAEKIFPLINDMREWTKWSPFEKADPAMQRSYSGAESGKGSIYAWNGNNDIGEGRCEIAESDEPSHLRMNLDFIRPFEAHNIVDFTLKPVGDATEVTWAMHGPNPYFSKVFQVFCDMDKMCGGQFEDGLNALKGLTEKQ